MLNRDKKIFSPINIGSITLKNRFIRSSTWESLGDKNGFPKLKLKDNLTLLSNNSLGLIISSSCYLSKNDINQENQIGLCNSLQAKNWISTIKNIKENGSHFLFQLNHNGFNKNILNFSISEIEDIIQQFRNSASLAYLSGADGIQLQCGHGFLISKFLSPVLNNRNDFYGGNYENRIRILKQIIFEIKNTLPYNFIISIKINGNDFIKGGLTPEDTSKIISDLKHDINFFEINSGINQNFTSIRTKLFNNYPLTKDTINNIKNKIEDFKYQSFYNLNAAKIIKKNNPSIKLALVGGIRNFNEMNNLIESNIIDLISLSRPLIKDPYLIKRFLANTLDESTCLNCSSCIFQSKNGVFCHTK